MAFRMREHRAPHVMLRVETGAQAHYSGLCAVRASHSSTLKSPNWINQHSNIAWLERKWWPSDNCVYGPSCPAVRSQLSLFPSADGPRYRLGFHREVIAGTGHHAEVQTVTLTFHWRSLSPSRLTDLIVVIIFLQKPPRQRHGKCYSPGMS